MYHDVMVGSSVSAMSLIKVITVRKTSGKNRNRKNIMKSISLGLYILTMTLLLR